MHIDHGLIGLVLNARGLPITEKLKPNFGVGWKLFLLCWRIQHKECSKSSSETCGLALLHALALLLRKISVVEGVGCNSSSEGEVVVCESGKGVTFGKDQGKGKKTL